MSFMWAHINEGEFEDLYADILMAGCKASKPLSDPLGPNSSPSDRLKNNFGWESLFSFMFLFFESNTNRQNFCFIVKNISSISSQMGTAGDQ